MALPSSLKLFIDPRSGLAFSNFTGTSRISNPEFILGDSAIIDLYLVEDTGISSYPRQEIAWPGSVSIQVAVGPIDEQPTSGTWTITYGANTTAALAFDITATALQTALNLLASITSAGGVTVSKIGDNYNIAFVSNGVRTAMTSTATALIPLSTVSINTLQVGSASQPEINLVYIQRSVAGYANTFTAIPSSAATVTTLSAWDGTRVIYRFEIAPDPKGGSFGLSFQGATSTVTSNSVPVGGTYLELQRALGIGILENLVTVTQVGAYKYDLSIGLQPGANGLTIASSGIISFSGYSGELSLNTSAAISLLDGAESIQTTFEVEINSAGKTLTIFQSDCTLKSSVIDSATTNLITLDPALTQAIGDGRYLLASANLSGLPNVTTARSNLSVYSIAQSDSLVAGKANLTSPTFTGTVTIPSGASISGFALLASPTFTGTVTIPSGASISGFALLASPTFTGTPTLPTGTIAVTQSAGDNTTKIATTAFAFAALALKAPLASPTFTGTVTIPSGASISGYALLASPTFTGTPTLPIGAIGYTQSLGDSTSALATTAYVMNAQRVSTSQSNGSGFTTGSFNTTYYPQEVMLKNSSGVTFWVPARYA